MAVTGTAIAYYYQTERERRKNESKPPLGCIAPGLLPSIYLTNKRTNADSSSVSKYVLLLVFAAMAKVTSYGKPALGGPWTLVDISGRPVTDADFHGEYLLLYFGFTRCPDICPSELVKVGKIMDLLGR